MSKKYAFGLAKEMMTLLEKDFQVPSLVESFKTNLESDNGKGLEEISQEIFGDFGRRLAERICELEPNYRDRTAEVALEIAEQTGQPFPAVMQGPFEIAMLAIMNGNRWNYDEISYKRLAYSVSRCEINQALEQALGKELADDVPCRHLCLGLCEEICLATGISDSTRTDMPATISGDKGHCFFETHYRV